MGNCLSHPQKVETIHKGDSEKHSITSGTTVCLVLPIEEPTQSFWMYPPSSIATHTSEGSFPAHADVVIIGSGISGASFARTLLDIDQARNDDSRPLNVVMLEAQETCSGATGRNGGHINPPLYHDYEDLKRNFGSRTAQQIMGFRRAHLEVLAEVAEKEAGDADCREVQSVDVFFDDTVFVEAKRKLNIYRAEMPQEASTYHVWEGNEAQRKFNLSSLAVGCITTRAGAVQPYRFVSDVLSRLLEEYPKYFQLFTQTPCTSITEPSSSHPFYTLTTPRGRITTSHVVHLTNAYVGGLVPGLANVVFRVRETMSAQRPGRALQFQGLDDHDQRMHGRRSYIFYDSPDKKGFDYLTQLSDGEHELMFGGGLEAVPDSDVTHGPNCRPAREGGMYDVHSAAHVSGALPVYFGARNWGAEGVSSVDSETGGDARVEVQGPWAAGRVKALWSGVLSVSVDEFPWVGRIPGAISGRRSPSGVVLSRSSQSTRMSDPGEWVAAGYSGEGMVHAWLCSRALALMVLGLEHAKDVELEGEYGAGQSVEEWLPTCYRITESRWKRACKDMKALRTDKGNNVARGGAGKMKVYAGI